MQKLSMLPNPHPHKQIHHLSINDEKRCYNYVISLVRNLYFDRQITKLSLPNQKVIDLIGYDSPDILKQMFLEKLRNGVLETKDKSKIMQNFHFDPAEISCVTNFWICRLGQLITSFKCTLVFHTVTHQNSPPYISKSQI